MEQGTAVTCFYFDYAARKEQSPINMLGSLLRQLANRFEQIPDVIVQEFENQKKLIGGRGLHGEDMAPLAWAASNGDEEVVGLLLQRNDVNPNLPSKGGKTPLHWAASAGHEGVIKLLLERQDVDPNRADGRDRRPLGCAVLKGHEGVVRLLLEDRKSVV